jgi:tetratricopeptide (TPR) repeat protein
MAIFQRLSATGRRFNRRYGQSSLPAFYLARIRFGQNDIAGALSHLQKALAANPGDPWVLAHLTVLTGESSYGRRLERYFGPIDAAFFLGRAAYDNGRFEMAADRFANVAKWLPEYRQALLWQCLALGRMGVYSQAADIYQKAMAMREDPVFAEQDLLSIFSRWAEQEPHNHAAQSMRHTMRTHLGHRTDTAGP